MNVRNIDELQSAIREGKKPTYYFFWKHQPEKDGKIGRSCLSLGWPASFTVDGLTYPSAQHFMMAEKARLFGDSATQERIIAAANPSTAKQLSREVQGFDQKTWNKAKFEVVVCGNLHKFGQDKQLRTFLLGTAPRVLVGTTSVDPLWGIGLAPTDVRTRNPQEWKGQNLLGFALMEARQRLANAA